MLFKFEFVPGAVLAGLPLLVIADNRTLHGLDPVINLASLSRPTGDNLGLKGMLRVLLVLFSLLLLALLFSFDALICRVLI